MDDNIKQDNDSIQYPKPTLDQIKEYLTEFGWNYTVVDNTQHPYLYAPVMLYNNKGIIVTFHIDGDFVLACSIDLLRNISIEHAPYLLSLNDTLKLVKIFTIRNENDEKHINADLGFELCYEAWNKDTFFVFLDFLCMAMDVVVEALEKKDIKYESKYINIVNKTE